MGRIPRLQVQVYYLLRALPSIDDKLIAKSLGLIEKYTPNYLIRSDRPLKRKWELIKSTVKAVRRRKDLGEYCPQCFSKWSRYDGENAECNSCHLAIKNETDLGGYIWWKPNEKQNGVTKFFRQENLVTDKLHQWLITQVLSNWISESEIDPRKIGVDVREDGLQVIAKWDAGIAKRMLRDCRKQMQQLIEKLHIDVKVDKRILNMLQKRMEGFARQYPIVFAGLMPHNRIRKRKKKTDLYDLFIVETLTLATNFEPRIRSKLLQYLAYKIMRKNKIPLRYKNKEQDRAKRLRERLLRR